MRKSVLLCLALLIIISTNVTHSAAQQPEAPVPPESKVDFSASAAATDVSSQQRRHPWGRFSPGAWSLVQVVNETFDENGAVVSTGMTETRTTLLKVEDDGVTLQFETSAWVSGKQLDAKPQTVKQCFHGGLCGENVKVSLQKTPEKIVVDGREIECKVESAEMVDGKIHTLVRTYYNDTISPFVFKRESKTTNLEKNTPINRMTIQVDALNIPCEVLENIRSAAHYRVVREQTSGARTTTLTYMSPEIPGGTICHSSKEVDPNDRVISRSILELTDFGTEPTKKRLRKLKRPLKPAKFRRSTRRQMEYLPE